jgi:predicted cobalt transporter CbtA
MHHIKDFIWRGLAAGALGGLSTALFLRFVTETQINFALRYEAAAGLGLPPGEAAEFSRGTQHWGGMAAAVIYGAVLGLVFGVVLAALHHRIAGRTEFDRAAKLASAAFVAIVLLPALKYPPNPPAVGDPDTIGERTMNYLAIMAASVLVVAGVWLLWSSLTHRGWIGAPRFVAVAGAFVVVVSVMFVAFPASPDPIVVPRNAAAPALRIADDTPTEVLAALLDTQRATHDTAIRDPKNPSQPLDLRTITDPRQLVGAPMLLSTAELVPHAFTTVLWHFRTESIGGLALLWAVLAGGFGLLADATERANVVKKSPVDTNRAAA